MAWSSSSRLKRMRDVEMVVNPFGGIDHMSDVPMMAFGTGSWVDLLVSDPFGYGVQGVSLNVVGLWTVQPARADCDLA